MHRNYLMAPGPTPIPERARLAMARQSIHHRGEGFKELMADVREHLQWLFETGEDVLMLTCSGTGAFEAAMTNFTSRGDEIIAVGGGKFGERWGDVGRSFGLDVVDIELAWGEHLSPGRLADVLGEHPDAAMVTLTASETSTGVFHPVRKLAEVVREESNALFAVDGITAIGVHRMPMDTWGIDVAVAGSQKAFGVPPGLGFVAANDRAWKRNEACDHGRYYFDLNREKRRQKDNQTAFTPAISVAVALREVLAMMREEGREQLLERHRTNAEATRRGLEAVGFKLLAERPSNAVTAALAPDDISADAVIERLLADHGITIAGGQKHLSGSLIRIGHIGFFEASDIRLTLGAVELVVDELGGEYKSGTALSAAQEVFAAGR